MKILIKTAIYNCYLKHIIISSIVVLCLCQEALSAAIEGNSTVVIKTSVDRPRLYLSANQIKDIKKSLQTEPYRRYWKYVNHISDRTLDKRYFNKNDYYGSNKVRVLGDRLPYLALSYLITNNKKYYNGVIEITKHVLDLKQWGSDRDIGAAHVIFGLSVVYDWLYDELPEALIRQIRRSLVYHAGILNTELVNKKIWWARDHSLLQNHNYVNSMAIAIAAVALHGEGTVAREWLDNAKGNFDRVKQLLSPDGASHEGVAYWSYGMDALLKYYEGVNGFIDDAGIEEIDYFRNAITYRLHMSLPGFAKTANYSDSPEYDYKGPGYMLRLLAARFNDGRGTWLADKIEGSRKQNHYSWLDLLWYDNTQKTLAVAPEDSETSYFFSNMGILVSRSGWDKDASWIFFKPGSSQGEHALNRNTFAGSHIHPDAGHFSLWNKGRWVFNDDGYSLLKKSENHNVILINGEGQNGEGQKWFNKKEAKLNKSKSKIIQSNLSVDKIVVSAQLSGVYQPKSALKSWIRSFYVVGSENYIIRDLISVDKPTKINSLVHSQSPISSLSDDLFCTGDYYLQVISELPVIYKTGTYSIAVGERRSNKGIYSGWLLDNELDLAEQAEVIFVITPAHGSCDTEDYEVKLSDEILLYKTKKTQWRLNMRDKAD